MSDKLLPVLEKVDLLLAEISETTSAGPFFRIVHRFREPEGRCLPGEEIVAVYLVRRAKEYPLGFTLALLILFNYLASHRSVAQRAAQIEAGIRTDAFYLRHGAKGGKKQIRRISRSAVKEYVKRIRIALKQAFQEAHLTFDPLKVLVSESTVGNEVRYRLRANVDWSHEDLKLANPRLDPAALF